MERNKTGLVVITFLTFFFIFFIAILLNTTLRRQAELRGKETFEAKLTAIAAQDVTIYWIGTLPEELSGLGDTINQIKTSDISEDTMPIFTGASTITVYDKSGNIIEQREPRNYSEYLMIVINNVEITREEDKEVLSNCIVDNNVPVLAIGGKAADSLGNVLMHGRAGRDDSASMYFLRGEGYDDAPLAKDAVSEGGAKLAEAFADYMLKHLSVTLMDKEVKASIEESSVAAEISERASEVTDESETSSTEPTETVDEKYHIGAEPTFTKETIFDINNGLN